MSIQLSFVNRLEHVPPMAVLDKIVSLSPATAADASSSSSSTSSNGAVTDLTMLTAKLLLLHKPTMTTLLYRWPEAATSNRTISTLDESVSESTTSKKNVIDHEEEADWTESESNPEDEASEHEHPRSCLKVATQEASLELVYGSETSTTTSSNRRRRRGGGGPNPSVQWSVVDLHVHKRALGDNPSVVDGPPLTLSWCVVEHYQCTVDEYEEQHRRFNPRTRRELLLNARQREALLRDLFYAEQTIQRATQEAATIRASRILNAKDGRRNKKEEAAKKEADTPTTPTKKTLLKTFFYSWTGKRIMTTPYQKRASTTGTDRDIPTSGAAMVALSADV